MSIDELNNIETTKLIGMAKNSISTDSTISILMVLINRLKKELEQDDDSNKKVIFDMFMEFDSNSATTDPQNAFWRGFYFGKYEEIVDKYDEYLYWRDEYKKFMTDMRRAVFAHIQKFSNSTALEIAETENIKLEDVELAIAELNGYGFIKPNCWGDKIKYSITPEGASYLQINQNVQKFRANEREYDDDWY